MKTKLLTLAFALITFVTFSQTYVPDDNFEQALIELGYDTAPLDDYVATASISGVKVLDISNKGITSLLGIEDFTALDRLIARFNNVMTVNLASNVNLKHIDLYQNKLTDIDVMANTNLEFLDVGSSTKNSYNNIMTIDLHLNVALDTLGVVNNKLTSLLLTDNTALTRLVCDSNSIVSLDLTNNTNLDLISCSNNTEMTTLTLPPSAPLTRLDCYNSSGSTGNGQLAGSLDVSMYPDLEVLWCYGNKFSGALDLSSNTKLENVDCGNNDLTAINLPTDIGNFTRLICDGNNLTELDLSKNNNLEIVNCYGYWGNTISTLILPDPSQIYFLNCSNNALNNLDVSKQYQLEQLYCYNNTIGSLNLLGCSFLRDLSVYSNQLTDLVLTGNPALQTLYCGDNAFTNPLIVSSNLQLKELGCWNNNLNSLSVSSNSQLYYLDAESNGFTDGDLSDLSNNPSLTELYLWGNSFTTLNVSSNMMLQIFSCGGNTNLSSIDLPNSANLYAFWAFGNGLTDISFLNALNRANLEYFDVGNGQLTSIDVSDMPKLVEFYCNGNSSLSYLNIKNGNNGILDWMWAHNTALSCIQVDSKSDADSRNTNNWRKPGLASYEEFCATANTKEFALSSISIYPNPAKDKFYIDLQLEANYTLSNVFGQEVKKGFIVSGANELDIHSLSNGLYLLNIETKDGTATKKIIKE